MGGGRRSRVGVICGGGYFGGSCRRSGGEAVLEDACEGGQVLRGGRRVGGGYVGGWREAGLWGVSVGETAVWSPWCCGSIARATPHP